MRYELTTLDFEWLREICAAADKRSAVAGVPLSVAAKLTGLGLVDWIGQAALTISAKGRIALQAHHAVSQ
jgi:hypothetical protein